MHVHRFAFAICAATVCLTAATGCTNRAAPNVSVWDVRDAVERYRADRVDKFDGRPLEPLGPPPSSAFTLTQVERPAAYPTLGMLGPLRQDAAQSQPTSTSPSDAAPDGYWRKNVWHQMGHEARDFITRGVWRGFKTSFWDLENTLVLTATLGASVAIRETGVDRAVRRRVRGHQQFGDLDETVQILGNPGLHFAGAGVLWLTSTLTKDVKQHEVAKSLTQALAVTGASTLVLKFAVQTRSPNGEPYGWPSGHTSSAFTTAAVLNEHYGPLVGIPSLALAGLVGYQRIDSREHELSDVIFGAMLGYIVGTSIARDEKAELPEIFGMKIIPFTDAQTGASGLALWKQF